MNKNVHCSIVTFVFGVGFVSSLIVPVRRFLPGGRTTTCDVSEDAAKDYYDIQDHIYTFLETAEADFRDVTDFQKSTSCRRAKENLGILVQRGKKDWANCLTDDYSYFGDFVNDALQNFLDFFCEDDTDHIRGYFSEEAKQCRADSKKPFFENCLVSLKNDKTKNVGYDLDFTNFYLPGKRDDLCSKILEIGSCTKDILSKHCPDFDYYRELAEKLFSQTSQPCDEFVTYLSTARIVGLTLLIISVIICLVIKFCPVRQWYADCKHRTSSKAYTNPLN